MNAANRSLKEEYKPKSVDIDYLEYDFLVANVWRVVLEWNDKEPKVEIIVITGENSMGDEFKQAMDDTFVLYRRKGYITNRAPERLADYRTKEVFHIGVAAGSVSEEKVEGITLGVDGFDQQLIVDTSRAIELAGLVGDPKIEAVEKRLEVQRKFDESMRNEALEALKGTKNQAFIEAVLETAARMAKEGDIEDIEIELVEEAVQQVPAEVFMPNLDHQEPNDGNIK